MGKVHQDKRWQRIRKTVKDRQLRALPSPCPRCGQPMIQGQALDLGHRSRNPAAAYDESNLRLEHRRCNRQDGQRITTAMRTAKKKSKDRPAW